MVVKELAASAYYLTNLMASNNMLNGAYQSLQSAVSTAQSQLNDDVSSQVISAVDNLQSIFIEFEENTKFPFEKNPLIESLGLQDYLGIGAVERLKERIERQPSEARRILDLWQGKSTTAVDIITSINNSLSRLPGSGDVPAFYNTTANECLVRIRLPESRTTDVVSERAAYKQVETIFRGFGQVNKDESYEIKIRSVSQSSPAELIVSIGVTSAIVIDKVTKAIFDRWKQYEEIQHLRASTENMKADTELKKAKKEQILASLHEIESEESDSDEILASEIVKAYSSKIDGEVNEVEMALAHSIKELQDLENEGGSVTPYLRPEHFSDERPIAIEKIKESRRAKLGGRPAPRLLEE